MAGIHQILPSFTKSLPLASDLRASIAQILDQFLNSLPLASDLSPPAPPPGSGFTTASE